MSSRIRGRRYRNIDPDERYGFTTGPTTELGAGDPMDVTDEAVLLAQVDDVVMFDAATVMMDGTAVTIGTPILESRTVILEPRTVTGPSQTEG